MRDDADRDGDDGAQGARLPRPEPKGEDGARPTPSDDTAAEVRRLALWLRYHAPAVA